MLRDFDFFKSYVTNQWVPIKEMIDIVLHYSGCSREEAFADVNMVIENLLECGIVDVDECSTPLWSQLSKPNAMQKGLHRFGVDSVVEDFYKRNNVPSELHIDLTDLCTEKCEHCYIPQGNGVFLNPAIATKVIYEFYKHKGLSVLISGGECLLHPEFRRICLYCRELGLNVVIFSNLTLCNSEYVKFFGKIEPQFINVSLYSMEPEIHDSITGVSGSWNKTMMAIRSCHDAGIDIRIATPLLRKNRESFSALIDFTKKYNMHLIPTFDIVARLDHSQANLNCCCSVQELRDVFKAHKDLFYGGWDDFKATPSCKVCGIGETRICLNANGYYYPCEAMHGYSLANARDCDLLDAWNSEALDKLRRLKNSDFPKCAKCLHRKFCKICIANNFNTTGNILSVPLHQCEIGEVVHAVYGNKE